MCSVVSDHDSHSHVSSQHASTQDMFRQFEGTAVMRTFKVVQAPGWSMAPLTPVERYVQVELEVELPDSDDEPNSPAALAKRSSRWNKIPWMNCIRSEPDNGNGMEDGSDSEKAIDDGFNVVEHA